MNKIKIILLVANTICLINSCGKSTPCDNSDVYTYLTPKQKEIVPYQGNILVKYKFNDNDTLTFRCLGEIQTFDKTKINDLGKECNPDLYLEILNYKFNCLEDSNLFFQVSNRFLTDHTYSSLDFYIKNLGSIKSEDYNLTHINHFKDSVQINGKTFKALTIYFNEGGIAGKWVQGFGLAQILIGTKYYTAYE